MASRRGVSSPDGSPSSMRWTGLAWTITPGSAMVVTRSVVPTSTRSSPIAAPRRSPLSTPFWRVRTEVAGPTAGRSARAADSVS